MAICNVCKNYSNDDDICKYKDCKMNVIMSKISQFCSYKLTIEDVGISN
jgi:hypothetical protein